MLISGLLTAVGLGIVVVGFAGLVLVAIGAVAVVSALSAHGASVRSLAGRLAAVVVHRFGIAIAEAQAGPSRILGLASPLLGWLRSRGLRYAKGCADRASQARRRVATSGETVLTRMRERAEHRGPQGPSQGMQPVEVHRAALRLNASGTRRRRSGAYAEAVELHGRALEMLRGLDDSRAVALTQNNLALALSHAGGDGNAIALFEEAAATLRALGEHEHEGQIIANLGLAHRRHGRHEQSENVLQLALTKLTPASRAYEAIEAEVRRAS